MKQYTGTKTVMAQPMTKSEAEKVLNRTIHTKEGTEQDGYLVDYPDGYQSWCPKSTFEKSYKVSETELDRMRINYAGLKEQFMGLQDYMLSEEFEDNDDERKTQLILLFRDMKNYANTMHNYIKFLKMEQTKEQEVQRTANKQKRQTAISQILALESLGLKVTKAKQCDTCPDEQANCKKLILADGTNVCVL